jgi:hypothetical protein
LDTIRFVGKDNGRRKIDLILQVAFVFIIWVFLERAKMCSILLRFTP